MSRPDRHDGPRGRHPGRRPDHGGGSNGTPLPTKDLGPFGGVPQGGLRRFANPAAARVFEVVEEAAVRAEQSVEPFLRATALPIVRGRAAVGLRFLDAPTQAAFERCGALSGRHAFQTRLIVRRWAEAGGHAHLDEHMAYVVAAHLEAEFPRLLQATVFSYQEREPRP